MKLAIRTRQWLVHGAEDDIVPPALSKIMWREAEEQRRCAVGGDCWERDILRWWIRGRRLGRRWKKFVDF
jgi:hypothetical protein